MATVSNIVINDGASTPVAHTFIPSMSDGMTRIFETATASSMLGNYVLTSTFKRPAPAQPGTKSSGERLYRTKLSLTLPTLETLGTNDSGLIPPPTVAFQTRVNCEFLMPERASTQNIKDIRMLLINALQNALVVSTIDGRQMITG